MFTPKKPATPRSFVFQKTEKWEIDNPEYDWVQFDWDKSETRRRLFNLLSLCDSEQVIKKNQIKERDFTAEVCENVSVNNFFCKITKNIFFSQVRMVYLFCEPDDSTSNVEVTRLI